MTLPFARRVVLQRQVRQEPDAAKRRRLARDLARDDAARRRARARTDAKTTE